jgi:hypothetical protein
MSAELIDRLAAILADPPPPHRHLDCDGMRIGLGGEPTSWDYVQAFQEPYLAFSKQAPSADLLIIAVLLPEARAAADAKLDAGAEVDDQRAFLTPSTARVIKPGLAYHDRAAAGCHVLVDQDARRIVVAARSPFRLRRQLSALLRDQIAGAIDRSRGYLTLHAAALAIAGRVVVVTGPAGAGKTTTMLGLLASGAWQFVANDRVRLRAEGAEIRVQGVAARCNLDPRVLPAVGLFDRPIPSGLEGPPAPSVRKIPVDTRQLVEIAGTTIAPDGVLGLVVVPSITPEAGKPEVTRMTDPAEAGRVIAANLLDGAADNRHADWLRLTPPAPADPAALVRAAYGIPLVRVRGPFTEVTRALREDQFGLAAIVSAGDR